MTYKLGIMQPYLFPYIGYFQLINTVDNFVFYDDVNFTKNGWINRNRIMINNEASYFTVQLKDASPFKRINEIQFSDNRNKIIKSIEYAYKKAPFYNETISIVHDCLGFDTRSVSELAMQSILLTCKHFGIETEFRISSQDFAESKEFGRTERIIDICHKTDSSVYINSFGGKELYSKETFLKSNITLNFLKPRVFEYPQFSGEHIPWLSIIDVLMFAGKEKVMEFLLNFELE